MNKETKVGLLVGLSFIVLFAVILSGRATDLPNTPEKSMISQAPVRAQNVQVVRPIQLDAAPDESDAVVEADEQPVEIEPAVAEPDDTLPADGGTMADASPEPSHEATPVAAVTPQDVADARADAEPEEVEAPQPANADQSETAMVTYTVKKGDSLFAIARRQCGDASPATIDAIYEANKAQMPNKRTLSVGQKIRVPVRRKDRQVEALISSGQFEEVEQLRPGQSAEPAQTTEATETAVPAAPTEPTRSPIRQATKNGLKDTPNTQPEQALASAVEQLSRDAARDADSSAETPAVTARLERGELQHYQVKKGDTWYKLAARYMGDSRRWPELYALNDDIFPDAAKLRAGVKIRVPSKGATLGHNVE